LNDKIMGEGGGGGGKSFLKFVVVPPPPPMCTMCCRYGYLFIFISVCSLLI